MQESTEKWSERMQRQGPTKRMQELGIKNVKKGFYHKETIKEAIWKGNNIEIK